MDVTSQGPVPHLTNQDLFEVWVAADNEQKIAAVVSRLTNILKLHECPDAVHRQIIQMAEYFALTVQSKWKQSARVRSYFLKRHGKWLNQQVALATPVKAFLQEKFSPTPGTSRGRPQVPFAESSLKTKKRRVADLLATKSSEELVFAAKMSTHSPESAEQRKGPLSLPKTMALYLDLDLSERKFNILRSVVNTVHKDFFPSVYKLRAFRQELLPRDIVVTETTAEVNLQNLLDKTAESVCELLKQGPVMSDSSTWILVCKWGFDGSSVHSQYKQLFDCEESTDAFIFVTAVVPLRLIDSVSEQVIWKNPRPSSTFFCRPVRFAFGKECPAVIKAEEVRMKTRIEELQEFHVHHKGRNIAITYRMLLTMLDGSAINTLSDTKAAQTCYICGATPKQMNSASSSQQPSQPQHYQFGLSSLHSWIRCFECLLHISYRLPLKCWQVKGEEQKAVFEARKRAIQSEFKTKMGLLIDIPKPGYGTTNDGNTARRFFNNPALSAEISGIDERLIRMFSLILRIIASSRRIHLGKLDGLLNATRDLYLQLYGWYYMPSSVHKLLIHGKAVISSFDLPVRLLSEEALEACHKNIRKHRLEHTRKSSRSNSNTDLLHMLLLSSDPYISSLRKTATKRPIELDDEIREYLIEEEPLDSSYEFHLAGSMQLDDECPEMSSDSEN